MSRPEFTPRDTVGRFTTPAPQPVRPPLAPTTPVYPWRGPCDVAGWYAPAKGET